MLTQRFKGTVIGSLFALGSFLGTWISLIPQISLFPTKLIFQLFFGAKLSGNHINFSLITLVVLFVLTTVFYGRRFFIDLRKQPTISTKKVIEYLSVQFFIIHPIGYYYFLFSYSDWSFNGDSRSAAMLNLPISSFAFVLLGVLIDLMRLIIGSRSK